MRAGSLTLSSPGAPREVRDSHAKASAKRSKAAGPPSTSVSEARLTNHKLFYPEANITKRQLAEYYAAVSEWMLSQIGDDDNVLLVGSME